MKDTKDVVRQVYELQAAVVALTKIVCDLKLRSLTSERVTPVKLYDKKFEQLFNEILRTETGKK